MVRNTHPWCSTLSRGRTGGWSAGRLSRRRGERDEEKEKKLRDMFGLIQVPSDAPIPQCAGGHKKSVVRPVCLFSGAGSTCCNTRSTLKKRFLCSFWRTRLQASIVFPAGTSLDGKCAERRGRAPAVLSARRKMIDPRLSRCTSFAGALDASCCTGLSVRRLLLEHSVLSYCLPCLVLLRR